MNATQRFEQETEPYLARPGVTRSTMMGFPCLRVDGRFFASFDRTSGSLIVKLPASRVDQLIAEGRGVWFAPAGRRFREWVSIEGDDWSSYLDEALAFARA